MLFTLRDMQAPDGAAGQDGVGQARTPYARRLLRQRLPVMLVTVAVLTVLGPFGTFRDLGLPQRLAYWGGLIGLGALCFELLTQAAARLLKDRARAWRPMLAGVALAVTVLLTIAVALVERALDRYDFLSPLGLLELYLYVSVVTALVSAVPLWLELRDRGLLGPVHPPVPAAGPAPSPSSADREPAFFARLPARLGRDLLALEMEDHYVRAHTALGSDLILMRLRDAVAELAGLDGLQVHRSYWVAASAVTGGERRPDGKLTLILSNGLRIPVSRSYAADVRAAGWLGKAGG